MAKRLTVGDIGRVTDSEGPGFFGPTHGFTPGQLVLIVEDEHDHQPYCCVDAVTKEPTIDGWLYPNQIEAIETGFETWVQLSAGTVKDLRKGDVIRITAEGVRDLTQGKEYTLIEDAYVDLFGDTVADFVDDVGDLCEVNHKNAKNTEVKRVSA